MLLPGTTPSRAEWPYLTEEASTLAPGRYSLSAGVGRTVQQRAARESGVLLSPREGTLWALPELEGTLGVGRRAEVSIHYQALYFEPEGSGGSRYGSGDLRLWTKLGVVAGETHGGALRFGFKVPSASDADGLGTDEADVYLQALWDVALGPALLSANGGLAILGDPARNSSQDDVLTWGAALRGPLWRGLRGGGEAAGQSGPFGVGRKRDFFTLGAVLGWHAPGWRIDLAGRRGLGDARNWGWLAGFTHER
ncbi:MAG: hypothetical protein ACNA8S_03580 [Deferrisomatales bacterium]